MSYGAYTVCDGRRARVLRGRHQFCAALGQRMALLCKSIALLLAVGKMVGQCTSQLEQCQLARTVQ